MPKKPLRNSKRIVERKGKNKHLIYDSQLKSFLGKNKGAIRSFLKAVQKLPREKGASAQKGDVKVTFLRRIKSGSTYKVVCKGKTLFVKRFREVKQSPTRGPWESEADVAYQEKLAEYELHPTAPKLFKAAEQLRRFITKINLPSGYKVRVIKPRFGFNYGGDNFFVSEYVDLRHFRPRSKVENQLLNELIEMLERGGFKDIGTHNMFFNRETKTIYLFDVLS